jgi:hypothetical protein
MNANIMYAELFATLVLGGSITTLFEKKGGSNDTV